MINHPVTRLHVVSGEYPFPIPLQDEEMNGAEKKVANEEVLFSLSQCS